MKDTNASIAVVMLGATGAVGGQALTALLKRSAVQQVSTLGRSTIAGLSDEGLQQHQIQVAEPSSYQQLLAGHQVAICTLGVGQPSKVSREDFVRIDKDYVLAFAKACKAAGIRHFELLSSVGIDTQSASFFLRTKAELVEAIHDLGFERFSVFQPSMILTPTNRYGITQALTLFFWPLLSPMLLGSLKKYRGIKVEMLGRAFVENIFVASKETSSTEYLTWEDFQRLCNP